jgi:hypothetical protein
LTEQPPTTRVETPAKVPRTMRMRTAIIGSVVSFVVGVGLGAGGTSTPAQGIASATQPPAIASSVVEPSIGPTDAAAVEPTPDPTELPTPEPTAALAKPVVVKGSGSRNTKPFNMPEGDFTVVITGNSNSNVIASLVPRGAGPFEGESLFNEISHGKYKYETVIYGVEAGSYYLNMLNDNAWVVTFTPLL